MSYVTPSHLIDGPDALREVSELYGVDSSALADAIDAGGVTGDQVVAEVVNSMGRVCLQATSECDARLAVRGYALPMSVESFPVLAVWARAIARYHLHLTRDRASEETGRIERDYATALRDLDAVVKGVLSLGANDPLFTPPDPQNGGGVRTKSNERLFSRESLGSL